MFNTFAAGRRRKHVFDALFSFVVIATCLFNIALSPYCICATESCHEHELTAVLVRVKTVIPETVAVGCLVTQVKTILHIVNGEFREYEHKTREYEACFPDPDGRGVIAFVAFIVFAYAVTAVPISVYRPYLIHRDVRDHTVTVFFVIMYLQNLCTCSMEIHFVARCFSLYRRFCRINEDVFAFKFATVTVNRYPPVLLHSADGRRRGRCTTAGTLPTAGDVEVLRMRHQCVRDAVGDLEDLYGVQLLLSLCALCMLTVIDTYSEMFEKYTLARSRVFLYVWLTHYSFRLCAIVLTTHFTMKQVFSWF